MLSKVIDQGFTGFAIRRLLCRVRSSRLFDKPNRLFLSDRVCWVAKFGSEFSWLTSQSQQLKETDREREADRERERQTLGAWEFVLRIRNAGPQQNCINCENAKYFFELCHNIFQYDAKLRVFTFVVRPTGKISQLGEWRRRGVNCLAKAIPRICICVCWTRQRFWPAGG